MANFKEPLSTHPNNLLNQRFTGAASVNVNDVVKELINEVPSILATNYGFKTVGTLETVTIGGLFNKKDYPGVVFRFPDHSDYSSVLVGFSKVGAILDVNAVGYGTISKNMQHSNMAKADHGFSLGGLAKQAFHSAMTDASAVEEEEMHYQGLIDSITQVVQSWCA